MDTEAFRQSIVTKVYHITPASNVTLHKHPTHDEIFYCVKGEGFGVLEGSEVPRSPGKAFIVAAGTMHALRSDGDLFVTSSLIPLADAPRPPRHAPGNQ